MAAHSSRIASSAIRESPSSVTGTDLPQAIDRQIVGVAFVGWAERSDAYPTRLELHPTPDEEHAVAVRVGHRVEGVDPEQAQLSFPHPPIGPGRTVAGP